MIEDKLNHKDLLIRNGDIDDRKMLKYRLELLTCAFFHRLTIKENESTFTQVKRAQLTAKFLISKKGVFRTEFIEKTIEFLYHETFTRQQKRAVKHLRWLKTSSSTAIFKMIQEINSFSMKVEHIIRAATGIKASKQIKGYHASRTALSALLSPFYQGSVGNCFSFFISTHLLKRHPQRCLIDFYYLLKDGKLSIKNDEEEINANFSLSIPNESSSQSFQVYSDGSILDGDFPVMIWNVPGLSQIGKSLGLKNISKAFIQVIDYLRDDQKFFEPRHITAKEFITELALLHFHEIEKEDTIPRMSKKKLEKIALLAYESGSKNPLLQIWNYSLSSLSEATHHGYYKNKFIKSLQTCLDAFFQTQAAKDYISSWKVISLEFYSLLSRMVYYRYDASLFEKLIKEGQGAFVLYTRSSPNFLSDIKRIDKVYLLQKFLITVYETTLSSLENFKCLKMDFKMDSLIKTYFNSDKFIVDILSKYTLKEEITHLKKFNIEQISTTPWRIFSGHYAISTMKSYIGVCPKVIQLEHKTTEGLLQSLLELCLRWKELPEEDLRNICLPLVIPGLHACNLSLKDPKIFQWLKSDLPFGEWFKKLMASGKDIAATPLKSSQIEKLILFINHNFLNPDKNELFMKTVYSLDEKLSISKIRDYLLDHLQIYGFRESFTREFIKTKIDLYILTHILDVNQKKKVLETAIPFASSNWEHEGKEIDIAFLFNPASQRIELWQIDEDKLLFSSLSKDWFKKINWEVYIYEKDFTRKENEYLYMVGSTKK